MNNLFGVYLTKKFSDIYNNASDFVDEYKASPLYEVELDESSNVIYSTLSDKSLEVLYYLLYARYGNDHIYNTDENQFKYKLFSTIYKYGPTWEKRLEVQKKLRTLTDDELITGTKQLSQHAYNPSTDVNENVLSGGEIDTTNEQTRVKYTKSKLEAYSNLMLLLRSDVTDEFISRFKSFFIPIVEPQAPLLYKTEVVK